MAVTSDLKPCPFCGGEADVMLSQSRWGQSYTIHHDAFGKCPAEYVGSMQFATEAEAIAAWNSRAERTCECVAEYAKSPIDGKTIVLHRCSACHELMRPFMNYCPNCGRKVKQ